MMIVAAEFKKTAATGLNFKKSLQDFQILVIAKT